MRTFLILASLLTATPALAQDVQSINEWALVTSAENCSLGTNSGDTVIAIVIDKAGSPASFRLFNPAWPLEASKEYPARLSLAAADHEDPLTLRVAQAADGNRLLIAPLAESVAATFKASDMLSMNIDGIDEFISANITDGPKIWAAMEACVTQLPK